MSAYKKLLENFRLSTELSLLEEKYVGSTDRVDREIEKLKEKKKQLLQQIQAASGEEKKVEDLKRELAQVEGELSRKDNDTYRKQNMSMRKVL